MPDGNKPRHGRSRHFHNWLSLAGVIVALGGMFAFLLLWGIDLFAHRGNPYMGILAYVVSPFFMFLGTAMALLGAWVHRRHLRKSGAVVVPHPLIIDFSRPRDRKVLGWFIVGAIAFLFITALGSNKTYHLTESNQFCGLACHTPMKPEFTAYQTSPHARVDCVDCHVGPGAEWYVKSKINGVNQLFCALTGKYDRPIKTPVKNLRPAQDTCGQCHWPEKFVGNLDRTYTHFLADETNTPFTVRLLLKVGGGDTTHGPVGGIHWHMNLASRVEYFPADPQRLTIPWVRVTDAQGRATVFRSPDYKGDPDPRAVRTMDCMDCHNRPAHHFHTPNAAVDLAMAAGRIDASLPWVKSNLVAVLTANYQTETNALEKISATLAAKYPASPKRDALVGEARRIFQRNFFPEMKADWRAYPDHIGHKDWAGCFRCHDGQHKADAGKRKLGASDCNSCHAILAQGAGAELEKLNPRGHTFFHLDAPNEDFTCANCHTGGFVKF